MSTSPDRIRADIERTRSALSTDVNALGEAVSPGNIARRQADKVKGGVVGLKDKVMGSAEDEGHGEESVGVGDRVSDAAQVVGRKARGNPLAAGLVALGAGWLVGSLIPASERERHAAVAARDKAQPVTDAVTDEAKSVAQEAKEHLERPARESAAAVTSTAQEAVDNVKAVGESRVEDVRGSAQDSADTGQEHHGGSDTTS